MIYRIVLLCLVTLTAISSAHAAPLPPAVQLVPPAVQSVPPAVQSALRRAGDNRPQIQKALDGAPRSEREGMMFLVSYMPQRDLKSLSAEFLLENTRLAYQAWNASAWKPQVPKEMFFNNVLPYASINEQRDRWRAKFHEKFMPLVKDAKSPAEAGAMLNQKIFPLLKVRYSTRRHRADQGPLESINSGLASCTGLSIVLIDACRSVGVPARFAGTPLWTNMSGNHSWVEIWDDGWHFTGAAEPTGDRLDRGWFAGRASTAQRDHPLHAIYAVSYKKTPQAFPLVWDRTIDYVHAVNVTDRYTRSAKPLAKGMAEVMFRVVDKASGERATASLSVSDADGKIVFQGQSKDERFDANDHLMAVLPAGAEYQVSIGRGDSAIKTKIKTDGRNGPYTFFLPPAPATKKEDKKEDKKETKNNSGASTSPVDALEKYLATGSDKRAPLGQQPFATSPLTAEQAKRAEQLLWKDHAAHIRQTRAAEMKALVLQIGNAKMPFFYKTFGDKPKSGRSMYISMHGGGNAPKRVNDGQWENQKRLYSLTEGVYVAPRAPSDTWNLWHQGHIDPLFSRLIENMIVFEDVDPDRVYLMGYSAGGDGVYQLAPRMADRFAAASMMAGHPNETSPLGLRNLPFTIHVGGRDGAYSRNKIAASWGKRLADLRKADPRGYESWVKVYPQYGHWLNREDAAAIPWMAKRKRNLLPDRIVWKQDDVTHDRFYWLAAPKNAKARAEVVATRKGQTIDVQSKDVEGLTIRFRDGMCDLQRPVTITAGDKVLFAGKVTRTIGVLAKTLGEYGDPKAVFSGEVSVVLVKKP